jgi:hypothetical protein
MVAACTAVCAVLLVVRPSARVWQAARAPARQFDLSGLWRAGQLRAANRVVEAVPGRPEAVHLTTREGPGVVWVQGSTMGEGTIEMEIRGRDVYQQSFPGIAFHRKDDTTYEVIYLRPFNFRATDPARHGHAVQYALLPDFDWPRLRQDFPEEFEHAVDGSVGPTDWVHVRVTVTATRVQLFLGETAAPTLDVRKLGTLTGGEIGLWVGNNSDGDFASLRLTPAR